VREGIDPRRGILPGSIRCDAREDAARQTLGAAAMPSCYVCTQVREELESKGCQIKISCHVKSVLSFEGGAPILSLFYSIFFLHSELYPWPLKKRNKNELFIAAAGHRVVEADGPEEVFDKIIFGAHAPDVLRVLGDEATHGELRILGAFQYAQR
jgi:cyclopropane-fatty-acyl-phospholipid synthase